MKLWKRNAIAAAIVLLVCGAVYVNWNYTQDTAAARNLGEAALVGSRQDPLAAPADAETAEEAKPEGRRRTKRRTRPRWTRPTWPSRPWPATP